MYDNYDDGVGEDGYPEPRDADDSDDEDPWKPLNPHEPGTLKVKPYRKVNFNRRPGVNSRKRASLASDFPLARLHATGASRGENKDYNCLFGPNENNEENEYGSGDNDFGQPDFDVPESADANEDVTRHAEKPEIIVLSLTKVLMKIPMLMQTLKIFAAPTYLCPLLQTHQHCLILRP